MNELTTEALHQLAADINAGRVFTSGLLQSPEQVTQVWPVLGFLNDKEAEKLKAKNPVLFYSYLTEAAPLGVNGLPMFWSVSFLNEDQLKVVEARAAALKGGR